MAFPIFGEQKTYNFSTYHELVMCFRNPVLFQDIIHCINLSGNERQGNTALLGTSIQVGPRIKAIISSVVIFTLPFPRKYNSRGISVIPNQ